jgi:tetratricopeptide (TPR) repeat protein
MFQYNPDKLEAKALEYERRGKTAKALKYREKAARLRSGGLPLPAATVPATLTYTTTTPVMVPISTTPVVVPISTTTAPLMTSTMQQQPLQQQPLQQQPLQQKSLQQQPLQQQPLQQQPLQQQPLQQQQQGFSTYRTPERYEQNALKWEKRGNWQKAQKNREKVWRMQNPQYGAQYNAPNFYNSQHKFLGYNIPVGAPSQGFQQQPMGLQQQPMGLQQQPMGLQQQPMGLQQQPMGLQQQPVGLQQQPVGLQQQPVGLQQQPVGLQQATIHHVLPAVVEAHMHAPIVEQTTRPERIVEVQPVIHREIEKPEVHVIEKHTYEQVRSAGPTMITKNAIVEETVRPTIIEEIQPVVHREVPAPFVERVEQHVTEHITQPTTMVKEVVNEQGILPTPGLAAGGPPLANAGIAQKPGVPQQPRRF